jgi:hypothetical protein
VPHKPPPGSDAAAIDDLHAIINRLSALTGEDLGSGAIAVELESIRAQLHILAQENADLGRELGVTLGLQQPDAPLH